MRFSPRFPGPGPDAFEILFLQGGATLQFGMVPMNLRAEGKTFEYVNTGAWAKKGISDAKKVGLTRVVWTDEANKFTRVPKAAELKALSDGCRLSTSECASRLLRRAVRAAR